MESHLEPVPLAVPKEERIERSCATILDHWSAFTWHDAVSLDRLSAFDRMIITTRNHTYEIVVTSPDDGTVLVRGGTAFPAFVAARIMGSSLGGSTIKLRTVSVGFRIEFGMESGRFVVTTPVETLAMVPAGATRRDIKAS